MSNNNVATKIFVFANEDDYEKDVKIRNFLKELPILHIILVNINYLLRNITRNSDEIFDMLNVIEKNPYMLPIIFYGEDEDNTKLLKVYFNSGNRIDMGWIADLSDKKEILKAVGEIWIRFAL